MKQATSCQQRYIIHDAVGGGATPKENNRNASRIQSMRNQTESSPNINMPNALNQHSSMNSYQQSNSGNCLTGGTKIGLIENANNQAFHEFMNFQTQHKAGVMSVGNATGNINVGAVLSSRKDFKLHKGTGLKGRHNSQPRGTPILNKNQNKQQNGLFNGVIVGTCPSVIGNPAYQQHLDEFNAHSNSMFPIQNAIPGCGGPASSTSQGHFFRQQALSSLGNSAVSIGQNSGVYPQNLLLSPGQNSSEGPFHVAAQLPSQFTGYIDHPSDRSTTAGTQLPHLQTTKSSSFHTRHRNNPNQTTQNIVVNQQQQQNNLLSQHNSSNVLDNGSANQYTGGGYVQGLGNNQVVPTQQQNIKLRQMPRRQNKILNNAAYAIQSNNSSNGDIQQYPQSRQQRMNQISGENTGNSGQGLAPINAQFFQNMGGPIRGSPMEMFKSESKLVSHGPLYLGDRLHQISQQQPAGALTDDRSVSPDLMPFQMKHRLASINGQSVDPSPNPSNGKISGMLNANSGVGFQSIHAANISANAEVPDAIGQIYGVAPITVSREIKIRKINPGLQKQNMRFQTAQHILNSNQQPQQQSMLNPSPLMITSLNSLTGTAQASNNQTSIVLGPLSSSKRTLESEFNSEYVSRKRADETSTPLITNNYLLKQQIDSSPLDTMTKNGPPSLTQIGWNQYYNMVQKSQQDEKMTPQQFGGRKGSESDAQSIPIYKMKAGNFSSEDRRRKFTSHSKFQNPSKLSTDRLRLGSNKGSGYNNFVSIPNVVGLDASFHTQITNQSPRYIQNNEDDLGHSKNSSNMQLESIDNLNTPLQFKSGKVNAFSHSASDDLVIGQGQTEKKTPTYFIRNGGYEIQNRDDVEISGFDHDNLAPNLNADLDNQYVQDGELTHTSIAAGMVNTSAKLDVIEEEINDETNKSAQSRLKNNNSIIRSNSTISSGTNQQLMQLQKPEHNSRQNHIQVGSGTVDGNKDMNNSLESSPILSKFLHWRKNRFNISQINQEAFDRIFHKMLRKGYQVPEEEFEQQLETLSRITAAAGNGGLTTDEIKHCIQTLKKNQQIRDRFQNPYLQRLRQRSYGGIVSRSGDNLNMSYGTIGSSSIIEENIIVNNLHSNSMISLSQSQMMKFGSGSGVVNHGGLMVAARGMQQQQIIAAQQQILMKTPKIEDSGTSGSNSDPNSKKEKSFDSKSMSGGNVALTMVDIKRLQFSQKHQSNKVKVLTNGGSQNQNDTSSNSLVGNALNTGSYKVRSYGHHKSQDGSASQKSDPNQNRLNKLSSGSHTDSYYIPNSGESFHYNVPQRGFIAVRQSKSLVRPNEFLGPQFGNQIGIGKSGFHDVLSGQKAIISDRLVPPVQEKIQGQLLKWREIKKLGQGTSGEVFLVQNAVKGAVPQLFVVKKLQIFSANSGIDKEAVIKLKKEIEVYRKLSHENVVKYIGSEIVTQQFCIYLEYMEGNSIMHNYQSHPMQKLPESQVRLYAQQILIGLNYLHSNKVVHGDLKAANVLVDESRKQIKLTDFGCARLFESSFSQSDMNGVIRGSLAWMAPEVLMNKGIRRKADIWSLGCIIIEMAVGGNPWGSELFSTDNNFQAMLKILDPNNFPPVPVDISPECRDFIIRCLIRDYERRPTAQELLSHPWIVSQETIQQETGTAAEAGEAQEVQESNK